MVYRHLSEFLLALGHYDQAREMAREVGGLARATRHPQEILAATLTMLTCDFYQGQLRTVHRQLQELLKLAGDQPAPAILMSQAKLLLGDFEAAVSMAERAGEMVWRIPEFHSRPELVLSGLLGTAGKARLLAGRIPEAVAVLRQALELEPSTPAQKNPNRALLGLALVLQGRKKEGRQLLGVALRAGRRISVDAHGFTLALAGLAHQHLGELILARDNLREATAMLTHSLECQESFCALGDIAVLLNLNSEAEQAFRRACRPTIESYFGRRALKALYRLVGLRAV